MWNTDETALDAFRGWCNQHAYSSLPADPDNVRCFLATRAYRARRLEDVEECADAISSAHRGAGLSDPIASPSVIDELARIRADFRAKSGLFEPLVLQLAAFASSQCARARTMAKQKRRSSVPDDLTTELAKCLLANLLGREASTSELRKALTIDQKLVRELFDPPTQHASQKPLRLVSRGG